MSQIGTTLSGYLEGLVTHLRNGPNYIREHLRETGEIAAGSIALLYGLASILDPKRREELRKMKLYKQIGYVLAALGCIGAGAASIYEGVGTIRKGREVGEKSSEE
ncbi:MAG: hypothetical protein QXY45_03900 [Candidatus Aenigmatarchaeota archaeon]